MCAHFLVVSHSNHSPLLRTHSNLQLASYIQDLEQMNVSITQIKIGNLNADGVCPFVAEALGMDDEDDNVKTLANITHKKT